MKPWRSFGVPLLAAALVAETILSLGLGRFAVPPAQVVRVLVAHLTGQASAAPATVDTVVMLVRLPRICAALLIGLSLSMGGSAYQTVFRNPLASPSLLGVAAGAGFGAAIGLLLHWPYWGVQGSAFLGGLLSVATAMGVNRALGGRSMVTLVLCGLVIAALFEALISLVKYFADPLDVLPEITFWLMGGLGKVTAGDVAWSALPIGLCAVLVYLLRWKAAVLSLSDEEVAALGVSVAPTRFAVIGAATLMVAAAVSLGGTIGWVGLIVPHAARMVFGLSPNRLYPVTALMGAMFLLAIDDVARSAGVAELPLGVLTALLGAPLFLGLLMRTRTTAWS